ncbi:hypothetical protein NKH78_25565 [Mesorhizobium sp. M0910]
MFVEALRDRGVLVHSLDELLSATMALPEARRWLLDCRTSCGWRQGSPGRRWRT